MEDLIVSAKEHKLLKKFQKQLEECYKVQIRMPQTGRTLDSDVVFISIRGENHNRDCVKKFLSEKMNQAPKNIECKENTMIITLDDSEEEEATSVLEDSICILYETSSPSKKSLATQETVHSNIIDDSVCEIENPINTNDSEVMRNVFNQKTRHRGKRKKQRQNCKENKKVRSKDVLSSSDADASEFCKVTSTTDHVDLKKVCRNEAATSTKDAINFVPVHKQNESHMKTITDKSLILHPEPSRVDVFIIEPQLIPRHLRPIVIDGNNVAIEHGRGSNFFSAKGIQLAIEYFLNRGHTQVTAFVPKFRRNFNPNHTFPTKDPAILDELAAKQLVVFTPSRRINGKCIVPYDDRFIVQLATTNGGVIVSNDNYRDLINESESFKEAIEKRLLMFCFVGDVFMVPEDPLGRCGPRLIDYLSFPPEKT